MKQKAARIGTLIVGIGVIVASNACNSVLGTDDIRTNGCPSVGVRDCLDSTTPRVCGANGKWSNLQACVDQACVDGACMGECAPLVGRCAGNAPESCDEKGQWFVKAECQGQTCLGGICSGVCKDGAPRCNGNLAELCGPVGEWIVVEDCVEQTCVDGACVGECAPGKRCAEDTPQRCDEQGQWVSLEACTGTYHCEGGECLVECTTGDLRCKGNTPQHCDGSGAWKSEDPCIYGCSMGQCAGVCIPFTTECNGNTPQFCNEYGEWQSGTACTEVCIKAACLGASCLQGASFFCGWGNGGLPSLDCCETPVVPGGSFNRRNLAGYPASVSTFRLDRLEVSVVRFKEFFNNYPASKPKPGDGAHPLIPNSGWDPAFDAFLPADQDALAQAISFCPSSNWNTFSPYGDARPMNCLSWYVAFAFCAWDGGRLPTYAEWNYAAAGGNEQRILPWSDPSYSLSGDFFSDPTYPTGYFAGLGDGGRWGHFDLSGGVSEWLLDIARPTLALPCDDCADLEPLPPPQVEKRLHVGGPPMGISNGFTSEVQADIAKPDPDVRWQLGVRCARSF